MYSCVRHLSLVVTVVLEHLLSRSDMLFYQTFHVVLSLHTETGSCVSLVNDISYLGLCVYYEDLFT